MASHVPGRCCTAGSIHEATPQGADILIEDKIQAYLALPPTASISSRAVLLLPDIFGIWRNSKLLADAFASNGFVCLIPDLFNGDQLPVDVPDDFDIMKWLSEGSSGRNPHNPEAIDPVVHASLKHLQQMGSNYIAAAGYCLGAKYVIRHFKNGIQCGFVAHPSFVESNELAALSGPLSIAAAAIDEIFPAEKRHESETILAGTSQDYQICLFSGVEHGFAIRGDLRDERVHFAKEQALNQAICWFNRYPKSQ